MTKLTENIKIINGMTQDLDQDLKDFRAGKITRSKAMGIAAVAGKIIKAQADVVVKTAHIELQYIKVEFQKEKLEKDWAEHFRKGGTGELKKY